MDRFGQLPKALSIIGTLLLSTGIAEAQTQVQKNVFHTLKSGTMVINKGGIYAPIGNIWICQEIKSGVFDGTDEERVAITRDIEIRHCNKSKNLSIKHIILTDDLERQIKRINNEVNSSIQPIADKELYGLNPLFKDVKDDIMVDYWTYPFEGKGDCEDYVIKKIHQIRKSIGLPIESIIFIMVSDKNGEGHMLLGIFTDKGVAILDNLSNEVFFVSDFSIDLKSKTGYSGVKIGRSIDNWKVASSYKLPIQVTGLKGTKN